MQFVLPLAVLNQSKPFGLSRSKPLMLLVIPFDKPRANGFFQSLPFLWQERAGKRGGDRTFLAAACPDYGL